MRDSDRGLRPTVDVHCSAKPRESAEGARSARSDASSAATARVKLVTWLLYPVAWLFAKLFYKGDG